MASVLHDRAWSGGLWLLEVSLDPFTYVSDTIVLSDVVLSEGPKTTASRSSALPLMYRDASSLSESFDVMLYMMSVTEHLQFTWMNIVFFKYSAYANLYFWEAMPL